MFTIAPNKEPINASCMQVNLDTVRYHQGSSHKGAYESIAYHMEYAGSQIQTTFNIWKNIATWCTAQYVAETKQPFMNGSRSTSRNKLINADINVTVLTLKFGNFVTSTMRLHNQKVTTQNDVRYKYVMSTGITAPKYRWRIKEWDMKCECNRSQND